MNTNSVTVVQFAENAEPESGSTLKVLPTQKPRAKRAPKAAPVVVAAPKKVRLPRVKPTMGELGLVDQVQLAFSKKNRLATYIGIIIGGIVPGITATLAHFGGAEPSLENLKSLGPQWIVVGGLIFSALTVYAWGQRAFGSSLKSFGFVVLTEGTLVFAPAQVEWLAVVPFLLLVGINGIATGCRLSLDRADR